MKSQSWTVIYLVTLLTLIAHISPCRADDYNPMRKNGNPNEVPQPCRLVDTRGGSPVSIGGALANGEERPIRFRNNGTPCSIPQTATAVVVTLTAVGPSGDGFLKIYPGGIPSPAVSNLNFPAGPGSAATANQAVVRLGAPDALLFALVTGSGKVHVLIDVTGYFDSTGAKLHTMTPCRLLDTRSYPGNLAPLRPPQYARLQSNQTLTLSAQNGGSSCSVPLGSTAIFATLTAVGPSGPGFLTLFPAGALPNVSTLNFQSGNVAIPNSVIVPLAGATPDLYLFGFVVGGGVDAVLDVSGYFK